VVAGRRRGKDDKKQNTLISAVGKQQSTFDFQRLLKMGEEAFSDIM
jgi:hypothetical protein